jgi:hypothetical protein
VYFGAIRFPLLSRIPSTYKLFVNGTSPPCITIVWEQWQESGSIFCMTDPVKQPKYWRERAAATRAKAKQMRYAAPRAMYRLLRVAEEYDKLAERCAEWQGNSQLPTAKPPEQ